MADELTGTQIQSLLFKERSGELGDEALNAMSQLRNQGKFPPPLDVTGQIEKMGKPIVGPVIGPLARGAIQSALPVGGQVVGGVLGGALSGGNPLATMAGASVGGAGGEALNQSLGITEPSYGQLGLASVPPLVPGVGRPAKQFLQLGVARGFAGREVLASTAESALRKILLGGPTSEELYRMAAGSAIPIDTTGISTTVGKLIQAEGPQASDPIKKKILSYLEPLQEMLPTSRQSFVMGEGGFSSVPGNPIQDPNVLFTQAKRLRQAASTEIPEVSRPLYAARQSILDALDATGMPGIQAANAKYRLEEAVSQLGQIAGKARPVQAFNDLLKNDPLFAGSFSNQQIDDIQRVLGKIALASPSGFRGVLGRSLLTAVGIQEEGAAGALGFFVPDAIGGILASDKGRKGLEALLLSKPGQSLTQNQQIRDAIVSGLLQTARADFAETGPSLRPFLKENQPPSIQLPGPTIKTQVPQ